MSTVTSESVARGQSIDSIELSNLTRTFDLFTPESAESISGTSASNYLNRFNKAFQAIDTITRILLANEVARDSVEPVLSGYLVGGLLTAAQVLSECSLNDLGNLAVWCDKHEQEARHG